MAILDLFFKFETEKRIQYIHKPQFEYLLDKICHHLVKLSPFSQDATVSTKWWHYYNLEIMGRRMIKALSVGLT